MEPEEIKSQDNTPGFNWHKEIALQLSHIRVGLHALVDKLHSLGEKVKTSVEDHEDKVQTKQEEEQVDTEFVGPVQTEEVDKKENN